MSASEVANMMAAPVPWTPRDSVSISGVVETPQARDDAEKTARPTANNRRRPKMSPITPAVRRNAAKVRE